MYYEPIPIPLALIIIVVLGCILGASESGTLAGGLQFAGALLLLVIVLGGIIASITFLYFLITGQF